MPKLPQGWGVRVGCAASKQLSGTAAIPSIWSRASVKDGAT